MESFANNTFEIVRKNKQLSNRDFANFIGIGESAYSKLKKGELSVGEKTQNKIKRALPEYNLDWLLYGRLPEKSNFIKEEIHLNEESYNTDTNFSGSLLKNKFESLRLTLGFNNRDFASMFDINETMYSKLKKGTYPIGAKTINKIRQAFPEYNIDWILYGELPAKLGILYNVESSSKNLQNRSDCDHITLENYMLNNYLTQKELAEKIGVNVGNMSKMLKGGYSISKRVSYMIKTNLGIDIPPTLIKNGFNTLAPKSQNTVPHSGILDGNIQAAILPFIDAKSRTTFDYGGYRDMPYLLKHITIYRFPDDAPLRKPLIIEIFNDNMEPQLKSGSRIIAEEVDKSNWHYTVGVVAIYFAGQLVVKRIKENLLSQTGLITLTSDNPNGGSFMVESSEITAIWKVTEIFNSKVS